MARTIGDHTGTTWRDFLVLPGRPDSEFAPEDVDISADIAGVRLHKPFLTAAMRSVTGKDLALAAGKLGMMAVAPRGLSIERQAEIVEHVKRNSVAIGEIESEWSPKTVLDYETLGAAIEKVKKTGHSTIPVVTKKHDLVGMFPYRASEHDKMDWSMPIKDAMVPFGKGGNNHVCTKDMADEEIKAYLKENGLRSVPVVDEVGRLDRLVFIQQFDAYKVGAAIDTHPGWERRVKRLVEAGADMIFIDTSDAMNPFTRKVIGEYKRMYKRPPICGGNVVTPEGFDYLVEAGADAVKIGMGPGSICSTNDVLGVGAPPLWSMIEVCRRRDEHFKETGVYVPVVADGGIDGTHSINIALTHADAVMGGKIFGCFLESEGDRIDVHGNVYARGMISEENIRGIKIYGEGSREAMETTGDLKRYKTPNSKDGMASFQGVSGWVKYRGELKPGVEDMVKALKEAIFHSGSPDMKTYRERATLIRLSEKAKETASPHGIRVLKD